MFREATGLGDDDIAPLTWSDEPIRGVGCSPCHNCRRVALVGERVNVPALIGDPVNDNVRDMTMTSHQGRQQQWRSKSEHFQMILMKIVSKLRDRQRMLRSLLVNRVNLWSGSCSSSAAQASFIAVQQKLQFSQLDAPNNGCQGVNHRDLPNQDRASSVISSFLKWTQWNSSLDLTKRVTCLRFRKSRVKIGYSAEI